MKPEITVSTSDLDRLEGLLSKPPARNRSDLDGLRAVSYCGAALAGVFLLAHAGWRLYRRQGGWG